MQTIRLTLNENVEEVLAFLEKKLKPLSRTEILKLGLTEIYQKTLQKNDFPYHILNNEEEKSLEKAIKSPRIKVNTSKKGELERVLNS
jgi:hypothetical protein